MSYFFAGSLDAAWPHAILLTTAILSSFAVAIGIVLENPKLSLANVLVVGGVALEAVCTFLLFGFDEGISNGQQSKIIALEGRLAARSLTPEQQRDIALTAAKFPGTTFEISTYRHNTESIALSKQIQSSLNDANWDFVDIYSEPIGVVGGIFVVSNSSICDKKGTCSANTPPAEQQAVTALVEALRAANLSVEEAAKTALEVNPKRVAIMIQVGIKP